MFLPQLAAIKLSRYGEDLLFYLYYMNGGDLLQLLAAVELYVCQHFKKSGLDLYPSVVVYFILIQIVYTLYEVFFQESLRTASRRQNTIPTMTKGFREFFFFFFKHIKVCFYCFIVGSWAFYQWPQCSQPGRKCQPVCWRGSAGLSQWHSTTSTWQVHVGTCPRMHLPHILKHSTTLQEFCFLGF